MSNTPVFIIGSPRSGTTWLQIMLGSHPAIAAGEESHLFSAYLLPLWNAWHDGLKWMVPDERYTGLASYLTQDEFDDLLHQFIHKVFSKTLAAKPSATVMLEKSPTHTHHLDFISHYLPNAQFIHVIRDGRDVAVSLISASKTWGRSWASNNVRDAAKTWQTYVRAGLSGRAYGGRYIEVRYESLLQNGNEELGRLFEFLKVDQSPGLINQIVEENQFAKAYDRKTKSIAILVEGEGQKIGANQSLREPVGFLRKGISGDWRNGLSWLDEQIFYQESGQLLVELGYESATKVNRNKWFNATCSASYRVRSSVASRLKLRRLLSRTSA